MKTSSLKTALACSFILAACSTSPQGRKQLTVPLPVSEVYSEADMRLQLATASSVDTACSGDECTRNLEFENQVQMVGYRLALAAYAAYPDLGKTVNEFEVEVAEKSELGSASNAAGRVVIYRGVQQLGLDDAGVAFLLAREMGHVIARHHAENSGTRILLSIAAGVLFPALNLFNGSAQVAQATQATSATTLGTTVASTATSYVGSKAIMAGLRPDQLNEADTVALVLLDREGWHVHDVANALTNTVVPQGYNGWAEDFRLSMAHVLKMDSDNRAMELGMQAGPIDLQLAALEVPDEGPVEPVEDVPIPEPAKTPEPAIAEVPPAVVADEPPVVATVEPPLAKAIDTPVAHAAEASAVKLQSAPVLVQSRAAGAKTAKHAVVKKRLKIGAAKVAAKKKPLSKAAKKKTVAKGKVATPLLPKKARTVPVKKTKKPRASA